MIESQKLQVLRTLDKTDRIGRDGVVALLQESEENHGAGLDPIQAGLVGLFLDATGSTNEETLANLENFFPHAARVRNRVDLMVFLDKQADAKGFTAWDRLLALPPNADETWRNGGRPANISWALDDMVERLRCLRRPPGTAARRVALAGGGQGDQEQQPEH